MLRRLDQRAIDRRAESALIGSLRMPLHAEVEPAQRVVNRLNRAVGCMSDDAERARVGNALAMPARHVAEAFAQRSVRQRRLAVAC